MAQSRNDYVESNIDKFRLSCIVNESYFLLCFTGKQLKKVLKMAAAAENGAPKTELQELQMKSNQVTDEVTRLLDIVYFCRRLFHFCQVKYASPERLQSDIIYHLCLQHPRCNCVPVRSAGLLILTSPRHALLVLQE